jgi:hypothetical protein
MTKLKRLRIVLLISTILFAGVILVFVSCAPAAPPVLPKPEPERMPPAVLVVPNVGKPDTSISYCGANFKPGEKVRITVLLQRGLEHIPGKEGAGRAVEVNELGSFILKDADTKLPSTPGVYAVRVYDEKGEMLASTVVMVMEKE